MRILTENLWWKVLSIALAAALWFALVGEAEVGAEMAVALRFTNLGSDLLISSDIPEKVYVKVKGPPSRLNEQALSRAAILLDLRSVRAPGERTFPLTAENVRLPAGVKLMRAVPSQVRLQFERYLRRDVPVELRFAGPPPRGYRIVRQRISPDKVSLGGPQSRVEAINSVQTDPIDISATFSGGEFRAPVYVPDPHVTVESSPLVAVSVTLERIPAAN